MRAEEGGTDGWKAEGDILQKRIENKRASHKVEARCCISDSEIFTTEKHTTHLPTTNLRGHTLSVAYNEHARVVPMSDPVSCVL